MTFLVALVVLAALVGGAGFLLYNVVVGAKKRWQEKVVTAAPQHGWRVAPGQHGFDKLLSEKPEGTATAFVFNGVAAEPSVAEYLRGYNTNEWLTLITRDFPRGEGPSFTVSHASLSKPDLPGGWTAAARELMQRSGMRFEAVSGGQRVTIVARGVIDDPKLVADMLELAHELTR